MKMLYVLFLVLSIIFHVNCNELPIEKRIYGGHKTSIQDVPYQVSIAEYNYPICGGSIINNLTIITAAHCTEGLTSASIFRVKVGATNLTEGVIHLVDKIIQHPNYSVARDYVSLDYDICILKLKTPIIFNNKAQPIALQKAGKEIPIGSIGTISGWGTIKENEKTFKPKVLYKADVVIIPTEVCKQIYEKNRITNRMLCAGDSKKDSCDGDSGGPLVFNNKLVGIISWGEDCADSKYPGVYTKISVLRKWIDLNI